MVLGSNVVNIVFKNDLMACAIKPLTVHSLLNIKMYRYVFILCLFNIFVFDYYFFNLGRILNKKGNPWVLSFVNRFQQSRRTAAAAEAWKDFWSDPEMDCVGEDSFKSGREFPDW